jgi:NRAMP (natural resistance-associated macrophage protein)-like metal ion transporter
VSSGSGAKRAVAADRPASGLRRFVQRFGPGLVTGAADDDPSGIGTYAQVGAQHGFQFLWLLLFSYPLMVAVQLISARVGRVTGQGLAATLCKTMPKWLLLPLVAVLFVANVINIAADLGAMAEAAAMIIGGPRLPYAVGLGIASLALQVLVPYDRYVRYLKWLAVVLIAYIVVAASIDVPWAEALQATFVPSIPWDGKAVTVIVAVLGTTISPYLFFWQASQEVEEQRNDRRDKPLKKAPAQAQRQLASVQLDTLVGMAVSNVIAFFIMLTAAVTLYAHGIRDIDSATQAARALEPVAGKFASVVFAAGIVGTGLLALPVLELRLRPCRHVRLGREPAEARGCGATFLYGDRAGDVGRRRSQLFHVQRDEGVVLVGGAQRLRRGAGVDRDDGRGRPEVDHGSDGHQRRAASAGVVHGRRHPVVDDRRDLRMNGNHHLALESHAPDVLSA